LTQAILESYRRQIESGLLRSLDGEAPLRSVLRYHVGLEDERGRRTNATGKLLRPSLVLFVTDELVGNPASALPSAVGLELIHGFSLIHDDIQDRDRIRRGRAAVWTLVGVEQAINAGDLMHALAIATALKSSSAAAARLVEATQEMIEGQCRDLEFECTSVSTADYLAMIDQKTGALLRCAFDLGGIAAGVNGRIQVLLNELGQVVGRAFQIKDDILGIWGHDELLGKATDSDIRRRKKTLPVVQLFERIEADDQVTLRRIYDMQDGPEVAEDDVAWVVDRLNELGVRATCETMVQTHLTEAMARLQELPFSDSAASRMRDLIGFLARRET